MFDRNRSGQSLYFSLVSAISGNVVINASGGISGRKSIDGGALALLSGYVGEVTAGQGLYVANLFDFDVNGNQVGFLFTASGCVPVAYTVVTQQNVSGRVYPASGVNAAVPLASISGVSIASGQSVVVFSGQLSGQVVTLTSGQSYTASGIWPASGAFAVATASVSSGSLYLASGSIFMNTFASGVVGGGSGNLPNSWGGSGQVFIASGGNVTVPIASVSGVNAVVPLATISGINVASGQSVNVFSGQLSGQPVTLLSGFSYTASGIWHASGANTVVPIASVSGINSVVLIASVSGVNVVVPAATLSGGLYLASGSVFMNTFASGVVGGGSGNLPNSWGGSGQVMIASGPSVTVPVASVSGVTVVVPPATLSGTWPASGANVVVPIATVSGVNSVVPVSTLSGVVANSGLSVVVLPASLSGVFASVPIPTISGATVALASGTVYLSSGQATQVLSGATAALFSGQTVAVWSGTQVNVFSGTVSLTSGDVGSRIPAGVLTSDFTAYSGLVASGLSGRCLVNAARKLVNAFDLTTNSGYLTAFQEDDSSVAFTQALTTASGATPVTGLNTR